MDIIGLTKCAETYLVTNQAYDGAYEYMAPDGHTCLLRTFRATRMPVTCSSGGVVEVAQEYINGQLFTCLVPATRVAYQDMIVDEKGIGRMPQGRPMVYDFVRKLWVLTHPINIEGAWFSWIRGKVDTVDWFNGILPEKWFMEKPL